MIKWFLIIFICLNSGLFFGLENFTNWKCRMKIDAPGSRPYISVHIPKEVYQYAQDNLNDIRIADESGGILPYYIDQNYETQKEESVYHSAKRIGQKLSESNSSFDFQALQMDTSLSVSQFILELDSTSFSKQIDIYSRGNTSDWEWLASDSIYNIKGAVKKDIRLQEASDKHFFRFVIKDNPELVTITKCTLVEKKSREMSLMKTGWVDLDYEVSNTNQSSVVKIKNPYHLRIIRLDIPLEGNFNRDYDLYAINTNGDEESFLSRGSLYRLQLNGKSSSNTSIFLDNPSLRFNEALLIVRNGDNKSLTFRKISAEALFDRLVFERSGPGPFVIYFGNSAANKPDFDIQKYTDSVEKEVKDTGTLSDLIVSNLKIKSEKPADFQLLFNILIAVISIFLVVFLVRTLVKKQD